MRKQLVLLIFCIASVNAVAQNLSKHGVLKLNMRSSGPVIQDDQVKGYYYFYKVEKEDRKNDNYLLSLHDENLREINTVQITRPKTYVLVDGVFNGEAFGFLFYDHRGKTTELITYDRSLKQIGNVTRRISNKLLITHYNAIVHGAEPSQAYLIPITNQGFLYYGFKEGSKYKYEIQCYTNELKVMWSDYAPNDATVEIASEGFQDGDFVGSMITRKRNISTKDLDFALLIHRVSTGEEVFRVPMMTDKYSVSFADVFYDRNNQTFVVFGEYNNKTDRELKTIGQGFITLTLDMTGKVVSERLNPWAQISAAAPVNEKGQFDGNNSRILFHEFVRTQDGSTFAIGEQYKKAANAAGIAGNVMLAALGGNAGTFSNAQLNVYNMVVFEFTADYTLKKVYVFEKDKNIMTLPSGSEYLSPKLLSYYARAHGGFDYAFTQRAADKNTFQVTYVNYDREKGQASKNVLSSIVYTPERNFVVDSMPLDRKSTLYIVTRAKEGYVMVTEYFKREKRVDSRLEKVNY